MAGIVEGDELDAGPHRRGAGVAVADVEDGDRTVVDGEGAGADGGHLQRPPAHGGNDAAVGDRGDGLAGVGLDDLADDEPQTLVEHHVRLVSGQVEGAALPAGADVFGEALQDIASREALQRADEIALSS